MKKKGGIKRVAIIGSQGVPPQYGGFETLAGNIVGYHDEDRVEYTVFCSKPDMGNELGTYKGARLRYVNLHAHGKMSVAYDIVSMIKAMRGYDSVLVLGVSGCIFLPILKLFTRTRIIVNVDGLEHRRDKWSNPAKRFLKFSLDVCVRIADVIVSDNKGIKDYIRSEYGKNACLIAYGGNHALRNVNERRQNAILEFYGLRAGGYDLSVCRIEPENNCDITMEVYANSPRTIAIIGNWNNSDYSRALYERYKECSNLRLIKSIYDLDILYALRSNANLYVHGHRAGGTNPSLVEAMFFGKPILCYDVIYNRETTQDKAYYYTTASELQALLTREDLDGSEAQKIACEQYSWDRIARQYEDIF